MKNLTLEKAVSLHRELWNEIHDAIRDGRITKFSQFKEFKHVTAEKLADGEFVRMDCFLCEYAYKEHRVEAYTNNLCRFCPLQKEEWIVNDCGCLGRRYEVFLFCFSNIRHERALEIAAKIAHEIANLPIVNRKGE